VGKALRNKPVAVVAGEGACQTLFVHAGLLPGQLTQLQLHTLSEELSGHELLNVLNNEALGALLPCLTWGPHTPRV